MKGCFLLFGIVSNAFGILGAGYLFSLFFDSSLPNWVSAGIVFTIFLAFLLFAKRHS